MSAASKETYDSIRKEGIAKPTTPDETQDTDGIRFFYAFKGTKTRASIYERIFPDKLTAALCIDGPAGTDNGMTFHSDGRITVMTGKRDPNLGASSGRLNIKTFGGLHSHLDRVNMEFNEGSDQKPQGDGQALNIICYGDYVEECKGSERFIKAEKILIEATSELVLKGGSVKIQSESDIEMGGTAINTAQVNKKDIVIGQKMTFGAGEETSLQFDPRANQTIVSPGHISRVIAGDYNQFVGGVSNITVAGAPMSVPLVKDRSSTYNVKTLLGNTSFTTVAGATLINSSGVFTSTAGGAATIAAGGAVSITGTGAGTMAVGGLLNLTAGGAASLSGGAATNISAGAAVGINAGAAVSITGAGDVSITGANVRLTGALIYLN